MITENQIANLTGTTVHDREGNKIGKTGQVYLDDTTGRPAWLTVNTGLFGTSESFVPIEGADLAGDVVTVPYSKDQVKDAPNVDAETHLDVAEEQELYRHYGLEGRGGDQLADQGRDASHGTDRDGTDRDDTDRDGTDRDGGDAMTRSEERLDVGTERVQAGSARLRKYVTTEEQTVNVPVQREEVRLEREPITDLNEGDALDDRPLSADEHEIVLTEERPVVSKESVPVERVHLDKDVVTGHETVRDEVRKENIDLDTDSAARHENR